MTAILKNVPAGFVLFITLFIVNLPLINAQNVNLTFRVDMSKETISVDGVHIAGDFQQEAGFSSDWDPAAIALNDSDNDNIYEVTVSIPSGTWYYKFINGDAWSDKPETPDPACSFDDGSGNYNRKVTLGTRDRVLPVVMFDSCNSVVKFSVNMSKENISTDGVHVMGDFQEAAGYTGNWNAGSNQMYDTDGDSIYKTELQMPPGNYHYVYVNGNTDLSSEKPPEDCTIDDGEGKRVRKTEAEVGMPPLPTYYFDSCTVNSGLTNYDTYWWNDAVFYEIFVRSFYDSDGDGIGDFQGIIEKLDYLNDGDPTTNDDLGITGIWLMPMMESPSYHGYDVTDYYATEPDYGTMSDFQQLLDEAHDRGIKVIIDFVMNHCSNQHPWFTQSANNQNNYRDWFIWSDTDPGFNGPWGQEVWHYKNGSYYYGLFWSGMPDLNYSHEPVKTEMFNAAEYWLNKGIDGFRLDAIKYLDENGDTLEDTPETFQILEDFHIMYKNANPDAFTVGEVWSGTSSILPYIQNDRLDVCFEFDLAGAVINGVHNNDATGIENQIQTIQSGYPKLQYATFLTNHDIDRIYSQFGSNTKDMKLAASIYLTMPGIPFIYYGEEIGMTGSGADENKRRPMQWTDGVYAGFSTNTPWQSVGNNYTTNNVADMQDDDNSLLNHYQRLIHTRNKNTPLRRGYLLNVDNTNNSLLSFARIYLDEAVIVLSNLGDTEIQPSLSLNVSSLPADNYKVTELLSQTTLDSLSLNSNGGFSNWQPISGNLAGKNTQVFLLSRQDSVPSNIRNTGKDHRFSLFPNPASRSITIENKRNPGRATAIKILDIDGKIRMQKELKSLPKELNIASLAPGLYFVKIKTIKHQEILRVIVTE